MQQVANKIELSTSIVKFPNSILSQISDHVDNIDDSIKQITTNMTNIMINNNGVGLAAIQIGVAKRIITLLNRTQDNKILFDHDINAETITMINPSIKSYGDKIDSTEACLSIPGYSNVIKRQSIIEVSYIDINGQEVHCTYEGFPAIVIQHEVDHLNGKLFIDHLSVLKRIMFARKYKPI